MQYIDDDATAPLSNGNINDDITFWVNQYIEQKELESVAPKTIKSYKEALESFKAFVAINTTQTMEMIGAKFINRFLIHYQAKLAHKSFSEDKIDLSTFKEVTEQEKAKFLGKNDAGFKIANEFRATLTHRLTVIKMFLSYISENNEEEHDYIAVFHKLVKIKEVDTFAKYLTIDELDEVIDLMVVWTQVFRHYKPKTNVRYAYRDSLLLLLYALTGARSEEVVNIKLGDISEFSHRDRNYYKIKILKGKGDKIREIAIGRDFIVDHIAYFKEVLPSEDYYLSSTFTKGQYLNKPHHQDNIRKFANEVLLILGIEKSGLHTFRRGYATKRIVENGVSLSVLGKELGNSSSVLEKYYFKHNAQMNITK